MDITETALPVDFQHGQSAAWIDFDRDGFLDIYVANGGRLQAETDSLYRNLGGERFELVSNAVTLEQAHSQSGAWGDYDNDGDPDLFVATEFHPTGKPNLLFRNDGDAGFLRKSAAAVGDIVGEANSVSAAWADFNNDGWVTATVIVADRMRLFRLRLP